MTDFAVVLTTCGSRDEADWLARGLVEDRLAACVQIVPIHSVYRWEGAIETGAEHLMLCKIRRDDFGVVEAAIRSRHTYATPEIVALPIVAGAADYLTWLTAMTDRGEHRGAPGARQQNGDIT